MNYCQKKDVFDIFENHNNIMNERKLNKTCDESYCMCSCHGMVKRRGQMRV